MLKEGTDEFPVNIDSEPLLTGSINVCELSMRVVTFSESKLSVDTDSDFSTLSRIFLCPHEKMHPYGII